MITVGLAGLGACGSDQSETKADAEATATFCEAVDVYAEKVEDGDKTMMANALEGSTEELPDADQRVVDAYIAALTSVPPNQPPEETTVEDEAEAGFRRVARETCGDAALPTPDTSEGDTTTSTSEPGQTTTPDRDDEGEADGVIG